jgi:hypothetical protein
VAPIDGLGESLPDFLVLMTVTPSGAIPLLGGVFDEPRYSSHQGLKSLGENLDPVGSNNGNTFVSYPS